LFRLPVAVAFLADADRSDTEHEADAAPPECRPLRLDACDSS
jgi:hypothetical protein